MNDTSLRQDIRNKRIALQIAALKKALWYLKREIQRHEQVQQAIQ